MASGMGDQVNMAIFWRKRETPTMHNITVSIGFLRIGFRISFSKLNPTIMLAAMAMIMER
jgi:hypothetical protein